MTLGSNRCWNNTNGIFYTDEEGKVSCKNTYLSYQGVYNETSDGSYYTISYRDISGEKITATEVYNPYYGYWPEVGSSWIIDPNSNTPIIAENHQKYVKLSGFVWLDKESGKLSIRDADFSSGEEGLNGVNVYLEDLSGNIIKSTTTREDDENLYEEIEGGEYLFEAVDLDVLQAGGYKVVFEYNGIKYEALNPNKDSDYGSKAKEIKSTRDSLDSKFSSVNATGGQNLYQSGVSVNYGNISNHESIVNSYSGAEVYASTQEAGYYLYNNFEPTMEEIRYVNCGLFEKEQTDYALTKDLYNVRVETNGKSHVYRYSTVRYQGDNVNEESSWNIDVKFQKNTGTYSRAIYKSDGEFVSSNKDRELKVFTTYKIALKNESPYLGRINSIVDYCDNRMKLIHVGTAVNDQDVISNEFHSEQVVYNNDKYSKYRIDTNTVIRAGETGFIYVQFEINRDGVLSLINNGEVLNNVAEINSYTTFKNNNVNTPVAVIDKDSVPGNAVPGDAKTYEDDTDAATSLKLELKNARVMTGTVFVDTTGKEGKEATEREERKGNGKFDPGETTLKDVEVKLIDTETNQVTEVYDETSNTFVKAITKTDENGNFKFVGFIPGNYEVVYTWGNDTYKVQYYKGTIYNKDRVNKFDKTNNTFWYRGNDKHEYDGGNYSDDTISKNDRYTDAFDKPATRQKIDDEMRKITINTLESKINKAYEDKEAGKTPEMITEMDSITPTMEISVEYPTTITDGNDNKVEFAIENVDFGIVERAKQALEFDKKITDYKITLANGQTIVDAIVEYDEQTGKAQLKGSYSHTTLMGPVVSNGTDTLGILKTEMDNELIEGAKLDITYKMTVKNIGELDYSTEDYYYYGITNDSKKVTVSVTELLDYVDGRLNNTDPYGEWKETDKNHLKDVNASMKDDNDLNKYRTYLTTKLAKNLAPGESSEVNLYTSKLLTSTDDNTFDNKSEISEVTKNNGFTIGTPVKLINSYFNIGNAQRVVIIPSTGDNKDYVVPIIIGVSVIAILGVGIFLIKKFVIE